MTRNITHVGVNKTAITLSIVFALSSFVFLIPMVLMMSLTPTAAGSEFGPSFAWVLLLVMPVVYLIFGYIFTAIAALIYNQVARFTGGIPVDMDEE